MNRQEFKRASRGSAEDSVLRAITYSRVSTGLQVEGTSLDMQDAANRRKAADMGAVVVEAFSDPGVSGAKYLTRPGIQEALTALRAGEADVLIAYKVDRAGRDAGILRTIRKEVQRLGCQLVFADGMNFENNAMGNFSFNTLANLAEMERELIAERTVGGRRALAESGVMPSRTMPPFGFTIVTYRHKIEGLYPDRRAGDYVEIEAEVRWAKVIFALFAAGKSLRYIAAYLNENGVPTSKGGRAWWPSAVRKILENPVYCGKVVYGRTQTISDENLPFLNDPNRVVKCGKRALDRPEEEWTQVATIPALVDMETWNACQAALAENMDEKQARNGGNPARRYLLTGLVFCPLCGRRISGGKDKRTKPHFYVCATNPECPAHKRSYRGSVLEGHLLKSLLYLCHEPQSVRDAVRAYDDDQREAEAGGDQEQERARLGDSLRQVQADLDHMKGMMLEGLRNGLSASDFAGDLKALSDRRKGIEERLQALAPVERSAISGGMLTAAEKLSAMASAIIQVMQSDDEVFTPAEKRELLLPLVERIVPEANGERALVVWKLGQLETGHQFLKKCPPV